MNIQTISNAYQEGFEDGKASFAYELLDVIKSCPNNEEAVSLIEALLEQVIRVYKDSNPGINPGYANG